jgi:ABC-type Fe3+ transport system permease subunit
MGAINIIIGAVMLLVFLLVFMQPILILFDTATTVFNTVNTTKYGTDSDGNVVEVGDSLFGMDLTLAFISAIGLAFLVGFIIWAARGGKDSVEDAVDRSGF